MTTNYHTPFSGVDVMSAINFNSRLSTLDSAITDLSSGGAGTSLTATLGEGVAAGQPGYIDLATGEGYLMDADASTPKAGVIRGFWTQTALSGATSILQINGIMSGFAGLTALKPVYVGTVAGSITQTRPSPVSGGAQIAIMQMGIAISTTEIFINPSPVQYHLRDALANQGELTITHHLDERGYTRRIWSYITETIAGTEVTGYVSSNRDTGVRLRGGTTVYSSDLCTGGTASASSFAGSGFEADKAFDNNNSTRWAASGSGVPQTLSYQFTGNQSVRRYTIRGSSAAASQSPQGWDFQYWDGSAWQTAESRSGETGWALSEERTFDIAGSYSSDQWRINITATNGGGASINELSMFEIDSFTETATRLAQTFTTGATANVQQVGLNLQKVGSPAGILTLEIQTVSGGNPTGTRVHTDAIGTVSESGLPTSPDEVLFTLAAAVSLPAGTYAIVLTTSTGAASGDYVNWGADESSPGYGGGEMKNYDGAWNAESKDAIFGIYQPGATNLSRVSVDWWSSPHADIVNQYGDSSGGDSDTKTTFKCTRASGFDDVTVVVEVD